MNNIELLQDFIKRAERNYKYKPNTAAGLAAGVKLFGTVMTDEELSRGTFPSDLLDEITQRVHVKFGNRYSVDSLQTYKSRVNRVLTDFKKYGADARSMASWNPLTTQRRRSGSKQNKPVKTAQAHTNEEPGTQALATDANRTHTQSPLGATAGNKVADLHLPLANDRTIVVYYPTDLTEDEASKIGAVLKSIAALSS